MTRERLQDLRAAFLNEGWELSDAESFAYVESAVIHWKLIHPQGETVIRLDFHLFGDLGQRTANLNDLLYCLSQEHGQKLYFAKRNTQEWQRNYKEFVINVCRLSNLSTDANEAE